MRPTETILVRRFTGSDLESFFEAVRSSVTELSYWTPWCHPAYFLTDAQNCLEFTQKAWDTNAEFPLGTFDAASGAVIGGTGFN